LSTVRRANRIVVLENGRITNIGSHEELLQISATYQKLYRLQFMDIGENNGNGTGNGLEVSGPETTEPVLLGKTNR
ncbi:MAG: hypothetical protein WBX06_16235, partial [Acidobacteriaceae bacterium]